MPADETPDHSLEQEILRQRELTLQLLASGKAVIRRADATLDRIQAQLKHLEASREPRQEEPPPGKQTPD